MVADRLPFVLTLRENRKSPGRKREIEIKRYNMKEKKEKKAVIDEFVTNQNGVQIKKCCASCATHNRRGP